MADPWPYNGPIERADGVRPWNHFLWPTEWWWAYKGLGRNVDSRWSLSIVALKDGRFSVEGSVWAIEENAYCGKTVVFATRTAAIRVAAARMIRNARRSKDWGSHLGGLNGAALADVINWARDVVAQETNAPKPRPVHVKEPPVPRPKTGLPLFDFFD